MAVIKNFQQKQHLILPLGLIIIGALSNIIDRLRYGQIIDFLHIGPWPIFNLADGLIVFGALLLIWQQARRKS
jgi:signal peptidase II